jgi:hypothetical protein
MIKPLSLLTGIAMAAAIGHTFEVKRSVTVLDRELRDIRRGTEEVEGRTQLLQAEWARLNDQERLRGLADRHLVGLSPMQSGQFQRLDEAVRRLPVAVAWNAPPSPFAPRDETTMALAQAWLAPATATAAAPAPAPVTATAPVTASASPVPPTATAAARQPAAQPAGNAAAAQAVTTLATSAQPSTPATRPPAPPSSPARAAEPAAQRPSQLADAATMRATRASAVIPEAPTRAAQSLPPVAAPPSRQGEAPARPAAPPAVLAEARRNSPAPRGADSAALPPVAAAYRPAVHVQRVDGGSMLGGQTNGMAPPVPYIR